MSIRIKLMQYFDDCGSVATQAGHVKDKQKITDSIRNNIIEYL